jgi:hypothetical protein
VSVYAIFLFLHVVGALGLFAAIGLEWAGLSNLRRATEANQVREWVRLLAAPRVLGGPAALIILITGIYMSATRWGPQGWIIVALVAMVLIAVLGGAIGASRIGAIARALPSESGAISPTLSQHLHDPVLARSLWVRTALLLGNVFRMSTRPGWVGALVAMGLALVAGLVAATPARAVDRRPAQMAGSAR